MCSAYLCHPFLICLNWYVFPLSSQGFTVVCPRISEIYLKHSLCHPVVLIACQKWKLLLDLARGSDGLMHESKSLAYQRVHRPQCSSILACQRNTGVKVIPCLLP